MPASTCIVAEIGNAKEAESVSYLTHGATNANTDQIQHITSSLKAPRDNETNHRRQQTSRLVATNHNIKDVDWLRGLNEDIAWIEGDPIQEISQQLNRNRNAGKTIDELHIVAHGSNGEVKLGNTFLTKQYLEESAHLLQEWKVEAIYLWSCEVGRNTELIKTLGELTGADVYASRTEISREHPNLSSLTGEEASIEELIGEEQLQNWSSSLNTYVDGLQVELFSGINFDGLIQRQQEETIYFDDSYITNAGGDHETWSTRSYGQIQAYTTGTNTWETRSDDRVRIWINGEAAQNWSTDHSSNFAPDFGWGDVVANNLVAGEWYDIKIEFAENTQVSRLKLAHKSDRSFVDELRFNTKAPIFQSSATSTDGTKVVLTYDEDLSYEEASDWVDAPNTGTSSTVAPTSSFAVTADGAANAVTAVAVSGATVELTLTNTITSDQTVLISYTDPNLGSSLNNNDVNAIQGIQGNDAASITNKAVTNNSNVVAKGVTIAQTGTTDGADLLTTEAGGSSTFTVVLDAEPTANVTVSITGNDATENSLSTDTLTFTTANWNTAQTINVTGVNDDIDDGDITTTLTATANNAGGYAGTESDTTTVKNTDNDTNGVTITQTGTTDGADLLTTEAGGSSTFTVVLDAEPTANVTVSITGNDATENSLSTDTLTFTTANWNTAQTINVTGVNDDIDDGDITTTLTATANNAGGYAGTESDTTTVKNTDDDTAPTPTPSPSPSPSPTPSPSPSPTPPPDTTSKEGDVYLLLDTSTSMLHSEGKDHNKFQCLLALEAFSKDAERAGYQFQRRDTNSTITSTQLLQTLANQTSTQAIQELDNYTIIDNPNDSNTADDLNIHLITYDYHVQHNTFTLSPTNPSSGIDTMQAILSLKMAGEAHGNSLKNNTKWKELDLPNPNRYDLHQGSPDRPSNLYAGTELLGALEGLNYLLNNKANDTSRRDQSTTISLILDGRPERRSWWDTRTNSASDSITGVAIPLPESLGKEDITTSGLLYDTKGNPHFFKNNQGQWQWKEMQNNLNDALDRLADLSTDETTIEVNAYGLNNTDSTSLNATYQDLFSNQSFDNSSSSWSYAHQIINSLGDINF